MLCFLLFAIFLTGCRQASTTAELPYYNRPDFTPEWLNPGEAAGKSLHTIAPFSLTNQDRQIVTNHTVAGKIYVANFFFTSCGSICPRMMNGLRRVRDSLPGLLVLSHSVMPERDSASRLNAYAKRMNIRDGNWHLLTGNKDSIYQLARRSYFADEEIGYNRTSTEFLHTENCVLIDGQGHIRGVYNATLELEMNKLIRHVRLLEQQGE